MDNFLSQNIKSLLIIYELLIFVMWHAQNGIHRTVTISSMGVMMDSEWLFIPIKERITQIDTEMTV